MLVFSLTVEKVVLSKPLEEINEFIEKYDRRKDRFLNLLREEKKPILFIRVEDDQIEKRVNYPIIKDFFKDEDFKDPNYEFKYLQKI